MPSYFSSYGNNISSTKGKGGVGMSLMYLIAEHDGIYLLADSVDRLVTRIKGRDLRALKGKIQYERKDILSKLLPGIEQKDIIRYSAYFMNNYNSKGSNAGLLEIGLDNFLVRMKKCSQYAYCPKTYEEYTAYLRKLDMAVRLAGGVLYRTNSINNVVVPYVPHFLRAYDSGKVFSLDTAMRIPSGQLEEYTDGLDMDYLDVPVEGRECFCMSDAKKDKAVEKARMWREQTKAEQVMKHRNRQRQKEEQEKPDMKDIIKRGRELLDQLDNEIENGYKEEPAVKAERKPDELTYAEKKQKERRQIYYKRRYKREFDAEYDRLLHREINTVDDLVYDTFMIDDNCFRSDEIFIGVPLMVQVDEELRKVKTKEYSREIMKKASAYIRKYISESENKYIKGIDISKYRNVRAVYKAEKNMVAIIFRKGET